MVSNVRAIELVINILLITIDINKTISNHKEKHDEIQPMASVVIRHMK